MNTFNSIILILFSCCNLYCQESKYQKDIELGVGAQIMGYQFKENNNYFSSIDKKSNAIVNFYLQLSYLICSKKDDNLYYKVGLGVSREWIFGTPIIPIIKTGISNDTSLTIVEISNLEYQLKIPLNVSYALPRFRGGYGFQLSFGLESRIRIIHIGTGNLSQSNYNVLDGSGQMNQDQMLFDEINDYYFNIIRPYSLVSTFGIGLKFPKEGASIGYKLNYLIIDPFRIKSSLKSKFGITLFGVYPLFNVR